MPPARNPYPMNPFPRPPPAPAGIRACRRESDHTHTRRIAPFWTADWV